MRAKIVGHIVTPAGNSVNSQIDIPAATAVINVLQCQPGKVKIIVAAMKIVKGEDAMSGDRRTTRKLVRASKPLYMAVVPTIKATKAVTRTLIIFLLSDKGSRSLGRFEKDSEKKIMVKNAPNMAAGTICVVMMKNKKPRNKSHRRVGRIYDSSLTLSSIPSMLAITII